jgi:surfeit locus 1 family protein
LNTFIVDRRILPRERFMRFQPALAQTVLTLLLLPGFIALGVWQIHRATEKKVLFAHEAAAETAAPQPLGFQNKSQNTGPLSLHVRARGLYDPAHLFLLDNRVHDGQVGYYLLAPLQLNPAAGNKSAVLINLGWVPLGASRQQRPKVSVPITDVTVTGLALKPDKPPFTLQGSQEFSSGWPNVIQAVQPERMAQLLGYPLLPVVIYPDGSEVMAIRERAMHAFGPMRHYGYAAQWFGFAVILVGLYLRHGFKRARDKGAKRWTV